MKEDFVAALQADLGERYRLLDEVGRGAMARVYRAVDLVRGGEVAVKVLRPELAAALGPERFLREIAIFARLAHPNILPLLDSRQGGGSLYFVTPYISGSSLQRRLEREGPLPLDVVVPIARDIAAALDYAHRHDVIHRDIKPGNVLLAHERAVVCDFGMARAVELAAGDRFVSSSGFVLGTPAYMSPEQAMGGPIDSRSDVYALGCVMYEMLTGEAPFGGPTAQAVLARALSGDYQPIGTVRPDVAAAGEAAIRSALASVAELRPRTGAELVDRFAAGVRQPGFEG